MQGTSQKSCTVHVAGEAVVVGTTQGLRDAWEATSFELEKLQSSEECVQEEQSGLNNRTTPTWCIPFTPKFTSDEKLAAKSKVRS